MIHKWLLYLLLLITTVLSLVSASVFRANEAVDEKSIFYQLTLDKRFTRFMLQIEAANLTKDIKNIDQGTVFAPVNDAFENKIGLISPRKTLSREQLLYHIIPVSLKSDDLYDGRLLDTQAYLNDVPQKVKVLKSTFTRNIDIGADDGQELSRVIDESKATNGMIQAVDKIVSLPVYLGIYIINYPINSMTNTLIHKN